MRSSETYSVAHSALELHSYPPSIAGSSAIGPSDSSSPGLQLVDAAPGHSVDMSVSPNRPRHYWFRCHESSRAWYNKPGRREGDIPLEPSDRARWKHAVAAASSVKDGFDSPDLTEDYLGPMLLEAQYLHARAYLLHYYPGCAESLLQAMLIILTAALYGLPHVYGWATQFQSNAQRTGWQIATITVLLVGMAEPAFAYVARRIISPRMTRSTLVAQKWTSAFTVLCGKAIFCLLCVSAIHLVLASILQLGFLPYDVFKLPSLSVHWPHIS